MPDFGGVASPIGGSLVVSLLGGALTGGSEVVKVSAVDGRGVSIQAPTTVGVLGLSTEVSGVVLVLMFVTVLLPYWGIDDIRTSGVAGVCFLGLGDFLLIDVSCDGGNTVPCCGCFLSVSPL